MESRVRRSTHREPSSRHCKSTAVTAGVWLKIIFSTRSVDSASAVIEWRPKPRCLPACSNLTHYSRPRNKWPISMNSFMSIRFLLLLPFFMVDFILALGHWLLLCFFFLKMMSKHQVDGLPLLPLPFVDGRGIKTKPRIRRRARLQQQERASRKPRTWRSTMKSRTMPSEIKTR